MQMFAGNCLKDKHFVYLNWYWKRGNDPKEENHLLSGSFPVHGDIKNIYGHLDNVKELVKFFSDMLEQRDTFFEEDKK